MERMCPRRINDLPGSHTDVKNDYGWDCGGRIPNWPNQPADLDHDAGKDNKGRLRVPEYRPRLVRSAMGRSLRRTIRKTRSPSSWQQSIGKANATRNLQSTAVCRAVLLESGGCRFHCGSGERLVGIMPVGWRGDAAL